MTDFPESHRDLLDAPVAVLSTVGSTGIPHSTVVWFLYDEGEVKLWLSSERQKTKNLLERPECSLLILDTANTFRYLSVRGRAELVPDPDLVLGDKFSAKYGVDVRTMMNDTEIRYAITIHPTQVLSQ